MDFSSTAVFCQVLFLVSIVSESRSVVNTGIHVTALIKNAKSVQESRISKYVGKFTGSKPVQDLVDYTGEKLEQGKTTIKANLQKVLIDKCIQEIDARDESLDKYIYLRWLQINNEEEFYKCIIRHVDKMLPIIYTPVVGKACKNYKQVVDGGGAKGITLNIDEHEGNIEEALEKWKREKQPEVKAIVVTDGERILGLGDLGANGMGIPVGKLALYTALGGVHPQHCLPVTLDVGTNNKNFRGDKKDKYVGIQRDRVEGKRYYEFVDEFINAAVEVYGRNVLIQFEDFANPTAYPLLEKYRDRFTVFNDDIQGTAAVTVGGILAAARFRKTSIDDAKVLFVGAGTAALGIASLIVQAMSGSAEENRKKIFMKDVNTLLTSKNCNYDKTDLRRNYCHEVEEGKDTTNLEEIILWLKPNILIGVSGVKGLFTRKVLENMAEVNKSPKPQPIIMPLSNPTSKSECTAEDAYKYAKGCLFASGSPFDPVHVDEEVLDSEKGAWFGHGENYRKTYKPMQCNNDNIFPGVAVGIILAKMKTVPNEVFLEAAKTLAYDCVTQADFDDGSLYPQLEQLRECSASVAAAIVQYAFKNKDLSDLNPKPSGWEKWSFNDYKKFVKRNQYNPNQLSIVPSFNNVFKDECVIAVDAKVESLDKYIYLRQLQNTRENDFYKCIIRNVDKMLPIIYTPIVGKACKNYLRVENEGGKRGLTLNIKDHEGKIKQELQKWKAVQEDVKAIVVTDGERILGLGDLGANGMGIPVGKLALYTALGGVHPRFCLPVTLDVGTDNKNYLQDSNSKYVGLRIARVRGERYYKFIDEFVKAVVEVYGKNTLIQFEDFANPTAYPLLEKYRDRYTVFNDDIQGTAAVAVGGILAAARFRELQKKKSKVTNDDDPESIRDAKVLFVGAGSAATGIGTLIVEAMGGNPEEGRKKIYMKDKDGLVTSKNCNFEVNDPRRNFCHDVEEGKNTEDLAEIVLWLEPNILIGVSGAKGLFTQKVLENMAKVNGGENKFAPIIMPLSNPTSKSECTAEEAYKYAKGCIFASGSPFAPVHVDEDVLEHTKWAWSKDLVNYRKTFQPMQCNNDNVFPGVALGIIVAQMRTVPNEVFLIAAKTLAYKCVTQADFSKGSLYPQLKDLRKCSVSVAAAIVQYAFTSKENLSDMNPKPEGWKEWTFWHYKRFVRMHQYNPMSIGE